MLGLLREIVCCHACNKLCQNQWWILGEANEAVASDPRFFAAPLENSTYSFESASDICSVNDFE